jgi:hypothetical protein
VDVLHVGEHLFAPVGRPADRAIPKEDYALDETVWFEWVSNSGRIMVKGKVEKWSALVRQT